MSRLRFGAMAALLALVAAGGLVALAPTLHGQQVQVLRGDEGPGERRIVRVRTGPDLEIGVTVRDVDQADAKREQLTRSGGAVIDEVRSGSPAEKAGFKAGDVVVSFDGERVRSARQLARLIEETPAGREVQAGIVRGGKPIDLMVTPESRGDAMTWFSAPEMPALRQELERAHREAGRALEEGQREGQQWRFDMPNMRVFPGGSYAFEVLRPGRLGVGVLDVSPELAQHLGAKQGVLVNSVSADSAAEKGGIKVGDLITSVNGKPVEDGAELRRLLWADEDATEATVGLVRAGKETSVKVTFEAPKPKRQTSKSLERI